MEDYKKILKSEEYTFLHTNEHLGRHMILLGLAGSYSYGTNVAGSDIDIRGITLNQKSDLIGLTQFEQYVDDKTELSMRVFMNCFLIMKSGCIMRQRIPICRKNRTGRRFRSC